MSPFEDLRHGYLIGYLAVKRLWLGSLLKTPAFVDRDLFINFLKCWIFEDWGLIGLLLDRKGDAFDWVESMSQYLVDRLNKLLDESLEKEVETFTTQMADSAADQVSPSSPNGDGQLVERGKASFASLIKELLDGMDAGEHKN